jgi:hypothetical protein
MKVKVAHFLSIVLMGLALVPAGAHLFELPNKIGLERDAYFTVQQIYAGWALFGIVLFAALAATLVLSVLLRRRPLASYFALGGFLAVAANLAIFFAVVFPTNQATANWTEAPENWETLRAQWEYGHAINAVVAFVGFCAVILAALAAGERASWAQGPRDPAPRGAND